MEIELVETKLRDLTAAADRATIERMARDPGRLPPPVATRLRRTVRRTDPSACLRLAP